MVADEEAEEKRWRRWTGEMDGEGCALCESTTTLRVAVDTKEPWGSLARSTKYCRSFYISTFLISIMSHFPDNFSGLWLGLIIETIFQAILSHFTDNFWPFCRLCMTILQTFFGWQEKSYLILEKSYLSVKIVTYPGRLFRTRQLSSAWNARWLSSTANP